MTSRQVKDNGISINGSVKTTEFTDGTKLVEQLFDAKLLSSKPTHKLTDNSENENVSLGFDVKIEDVDEPFSALVYENYLNKVRETNEDAFAEGDSVVLAVSYAKNREGKWTKYGRLSLPQVTTVNDVLTDDMICDELKAVMQGAEESADAEAQTTSA